MEQHLQSIFDLIKADVNLSEDEKAAIIARLNDADKKMSIDAFRIERGESLKKTMSVLLEETIEELEQKRKVVEEKNCDLEIEAALERVRTVAMSMRAADDLLNICQILFEELTALGFSELRNAMINIVNDEKGSFLNYDFNSGSGASVTQFLYNSHPVMERQVAMTRSANDAFFEHILTGADLEDFKAFRVRNGEAPDPKLENIAALYYYFYSIGIGSVGISTFCSLLAEKREVLKRFRNVFDLAYRRYTDIQLAGAQAREAQIELALERVRARTMAMQRSEELGETAFVLFEQFKELGDAPDQITIGIMNESENLVEFWVTINGKSTDQMFKFSIDEPTVMHKLYTAWKEQKRSLVIDLTGEKLQDYLAYRANVGQGKVSNKMPENRRVINAAFFSKGVITFSTTEPRPEETIRLLERFAGVFDGTYTRFLDLKKAEAQARESHIELALERVRARTMAMQRSEELAETVFILFQQFKELGENPDQATIGIINEKEHVIEYWVTMYGSQINKVFKFSIDEPNVTQEIYKGWKAKKTSLVIDLSGKALHAFMKYRESMGGAKFNKDEKRRMINVAFFSKGLINVQSSELRSVESIRLLERFAGVFEQTYTRFLDLQKAEAQAREAHIEAALERVRSRTMGMQKSDELNEIIKVVYEQFGHLNILTEHAGFIMDYQAKDDMTIWLADKHYAPSLVTIPYFDSPHWNSFNEAKEKRISFFANLLSFEEKNKFYQDLFKRIPGVTDQTKEYYLNCPGLAISTVLLENVGLYIENFSGIPYTDEENNTLMRFGKVFQQTYTRFLDLEKAEAQAREARIEASLERTRTQSMIMQHSNELDDTLRVFHEQVLLLDIPSAFSFLWLPDEKNDRHIFWAAWAENNSKDFRSKAIDYPLDRNEPATAQCLVDWKGNEPVVSYHVPPAGVESYFAAWKELITGVEQLKPEYYKDGLFYIEAFMKYGCFGVMVESSLSQEEKKILGRFAIEFERTYTRFLDLQRAEAQAREAQIENALEKVRSRSLAMHKSDELRDVVKVVFEKLQELGFAIDGAAFIAVPIENSRDLNIWIGDDHTEYPSCFRTPFYDSPVYLDIWAARDSGSDFFLATYSFEEKTPWFNYIFEHSDYKHLPANLKSWILEQAFLTQCFATAKHSAIGIHFHYQRTLSENEIDTLKRFSKVFDQAYVRFLDLQKAEAQARESQIQLALERVRAKAMAMYRSEELNEVLSVLIEQFDVLGIQPMKAVLSLFDAEKRMFTFRTTGRTGRRIIGEQVFDIDSNDGFKGVFETWKNSEPNSVFKSYISKETLPDVWKLFPKSFANMPEEAWVYPIDYPDGLYNTFAWCKFGFIGFDHTRAATKEEEDIAIRFANEFERLYQRFLDLQKAEKQARQAQIEAAMEKVRSRSLAMQKPEELVEVAQVLRQEMALLGVEELETSSIYIHHEDSGKTECWYAIKDEHKLVADHMEIQLENTWVGRQMLNFYHSDKYQISIPMRGANRKQWINYCSSKSKLLDGFYGDTIPDRTYHLSKFSNGYMGAASPGDISPESRELLQRATSVFSFAYTRFSDLQQAEAQAREAQIEAALERVRSKTMAMHSSGDVADTVGTMFNELVKLGVEKMVRCGIGILTHGSYQMEVWTAKLGEYEKAELVIGHFDMAIHPMLRGIYDAWEKKAPSFSYVMEGEDMVKYFEAINNEPDYPMKYDISKLPSPQFHNDFFFPEGVLFAFTSQPLGIEITSIFKRFAGVFGQTYRRYLDLQKAEAQAREAQIQLALERVRARTMAMQQSDELAETSVEVFRQLISLGIAPNRLFIGIIKDNSGDIEFWATDEDGSKISTKFTGNIKSNRSIKKMYDTWKAGKKSLIVEMQGKELTDYFRYLADELKVPFKLGRTQKRRVQSIACFSQGFIGMASPEAQPEETISLMERFAGVFNLTYTRFSDLKQAEEQARESKIEAALEKVRGKALAMYSSADLTSTASMVFTELRKLGINPIRCGVGMMNNKSRKVALYSATTSAAGDGLGLLGWVMLSDHPVLDKIYDSLLAGQDFFPVLEGQQLKAYYGKILSGLSLPTLPDFHPGEEQYGHFFPFADGCLYAWAEKAYDDTEIRVLKRFASVIDLTFRRYTELQKSETSAREAVRAASLDRVRAEIASMRSTDDLERITPLIWNELTILGIPFLRCGVFIVDEQAQLIYTHLSTADGRAISTFNLPFNAEGIGELVLTAWRAKQVARLHWTAEEFAYNTNNLVSRGTVTSTDRYVTEHPDISLDLHFAPFLQGMLYVGNTSSLTADEIDLVQSLADAFSTAYARYEDFNKLEAAKQQVENTLTDLKAAQTKLIQSEKMASLGELTAGIAHEIQNPLNFVNNFSEVNQEMIDELEEELKAGNIEEALTLAADIKQNEEKINHHGKRADGIVKGMLQHSRTGGGEKLPTNINSLADEFMRLSYHGLRAKDKTFNAEMVTHFDPELPKIKVIGQDMGRVLLNLFNNAFYAVNQKKKLTIKDYVPEVVVTTSTENGHVIIKVKDNGVGIPDHIKEKIMQPFFTTKPTGEGTGLGLSLTYDMVVKGHSGSIQANSKEGEGSEFVIQLPIDAKS